MRVEAFDPYSAPASPELLTLLFGSPPIDQLLSASVLDLAMEGAPTSCLVRGRMAFSHYALRGPPNRLHGGLHLIARTLLVAQRLGARWPSEALFPCAAWVRLGAALPLKSPVPFEGCVGEGDAGRRYLVTRFAGTSRLEGALWSLGRAPGDDPALAARWRRWAGEARQSPARTFETERIGVRYVHDAHMSVARFSPEDLRRPENPWQRFRTPSGGLSIALASYQLDNAAAASRMADLDHPCFTTRLALSFVQAELPTDRPLLFCAARGTRSRAPHARARPVHVRGVGHGTETAEVVLASEGFEQVYAHGFIDTHPM